MGALGFELLEAGTRVDENQLLVVQLAARFSASDEWAIAGYSTAGRWIADHLDIALRTANEWIRVGLALERLPVTTQALREREISYAKAKVLTRTARPSTEAALLEIAMRVPASELGKAIAAWSQQNETDADVAERQREAESLRWQVDVDGMISGSFRLAPQHGGVLVAAVDAQVLRHPPRPIAGAGEEAQRWPSLARHRADALLALLGGGDPAASSNPPTGGAVFEVVLHVRGDGCTLDDGTPLTEHAVARLLPASFVRALVHDAERRPINGSSRRRHPTVRQKRVVKERDRACIDCGGHDLLEYDHEPGFDETGRTVVEELRLRCAVCHRFRHRRLANRRASGDAA